MIYLSDFFKQTTAKKSPLWGYRGENFEELCFLTGLCVIEKKKTIFNSAHKPHCLEISLHNK